MTDANSPLAHKAAEQQGKDYCLRIYPAPGDPASQARFSHLYLLLHGSGTGSVMLSPSPPIHLKAHFEPVAEASEQTQNEDSSEQQAPKAGHSITGRQIYTSRTPRHAGKFWGLALTTDPRDTKAISRWERVEILEGPTESGWTFEVVEIDTTPPASDATVDIKDQGIGKRVAEQLVWKGGPLRPAGEKQSDDTQSGESYEWRSWMACHSQFGHPQLYWITNKLEEGSLPAHCEQVIVVREWL